MTIGPVAPKLSRVEVSETKLAGVRLIQPRIFEDDRGYFFEPYNRARYMEHGIDADFVMDGESRSSAGTVRGLHFRNPPEAKLVRCVHGAIWDVVVDLRPDSPTFGQWMGTELSAENHHQLYIPQGFAHGFSVLTETALMLYKKSELYDPSAEKGLLWCDETVAVDWKIKPDTLSERDQQHPALKELGLR